MNTKYIDTPDGRIKMTFHKVDVKPRPRWFRRIGLILFWWIGLLDCCYVNRYSFSDYVKGMKGLWNL